MSTSLARPEETGLLSPAQFARIAEIAKREAGLALSVAKTSMISARIARRLRDTGKPDFAAYVAYLESGAGADELRMLISALTTNVTHSSGRIIISGSSKPRCSTGSRPRRRPAARSGCGRRAARRGRSPTRSRSRSCGGFRKHWPMTFAFSQPTSTKSALGRAIRGRYTRAQLEGVPPRIGGASSRSAMAARWKSERIYAGSSPSAR